MTEDEVAEQLELLPKVTRKITLGELESHLLEAANILRGPIDQADFKSYIFPLLFFKRISDVYWEEYRQALDESGGDVEYARFAENHRFQIPGHCHWKVVQYAPKNIGAKLVAAFRDIEKANSDTLYGIFGDAPWANKERISDEVLRTLLEHFSSQPLTNEAVEPDVLGQAYEYLIKKFADLSNKKAGEFYTPRSVVKLLVEILNPKEGETVYDPACGTGGMLIEVVQHILRGGGRPQMLYGKLFGQEKNLTTAGIARMNLFIHSVEDFQIVRGDTLRQPVFFDGDSLATFDCVIANPPFSLKAWGEDLWKNDPFGRKFAGIPPRSSADYAWVQHMMTSMAPRSGRVGVVLPQGALFRTKSESGIRRSVLETDKVEAVIGLAPNLFYGTGLAACIVIIRDQKPADRKGRVLFIDASDQFRRGRTQNTLEAEHVDRILEWYRAYADISGRSHVADMTEIARNDYNLNIQLYVSPTDSDNVLDVEEATARLDAALADAEQAEDRFRTQLKEWGLLS
ncbi:class I SAM-dependent DNA methyltransferase [Nocardia transvalensis]|uniref:type I restriction-modification system subunit M n=1 Tax=Nocardia transvalensis TaxID=37333 RepID=UPI002B4B6BDE|nr:class I SAM-dependent DNA methyltransferase [Nocardia transvalensis]